MTKLVGEHFLPNYDPKKNVKLKDKNKDHYNIENLYQTEKTKYQKKNKQKVILIKNQKYEVDLDNLKLIHLNQD